MNMRLVVQRVSEASVEIEGKINGQIKQGFMVLVGITNDDNEKIVDNYGLSPSGRYMSGAYQSGS